MKIEPVKIVDFLLVDRSRAKWGYIEKIQAFDFWVFFPGRFWIYEIRLKINRFLSVWAARIKVNYHRQRRWLENQYLEGTLRNL